MNKNHKKNIFLVVAVVVVMIATILILDIFDGKKDEGSEGEKVSTEVVDNVETSTDEVITDEGNTECIKTFSSEDYPKFSFDYDACKWEITDEGKNIKGRLVGNDHPVNLLLSTSNSKMSIQITLFMGFGIGEGALCVEDYKRLGAESYRLKNLTTKFSAADSTEIMAYTYRSQLYLRGSSKYNDAVDKYANSNHYIAYSQNFERYANTLLTNLSLQERERRFAACAPLEFFAFTTTNIDKTDSPEYFGDADGTIEGFIVVWLDSQNQEDIESADRIVEEMRY